MDDSFLDTTLDMQATLAKANADPSVLKAAIKLKYKYPTLVQSKLFELSEEKKHIIVKSKARSGKTSGSLLLALHKMVQSINENKKKKPHFVVIICPNKAVCNSNEALLEKIIGFAKEDYGVSHLNLTKTAYEIFENEMFLEAKKRLIVIGTPALFKKMLLSLPNTDYFHQNVETIFLDELNFMFSFGYEGDVHELLSFYKDRAEEINVLFSLSTEDERIKALKSLIMRGSVTIKFNDQAADENGKQGNSGGATLYNEFFFIADDITKYISIYVLFKLKFITGRTLIICRDLDEAYKVNAFIERCQIKTSKVYSPEWPLKIRQYFLTVFNTSLINILVSTDEILEVGKQSPKNKSGLREVENIIVMDLSIITETYEKVHSFLNSRKSIPCLIEFLNQDDESKELLFSLLEQTKSKNNTNTIQELPLKDEQLKSFTYRCTDIYKGITKKQISILKTVDVKKQIIKSKELKEYFDDHQKERNLIVSDIEKLCQQVSHHSVKMQDNVPSYLIKGVNDTDALFKEGGEEESKTQKRKVLKLKYNEDYESSLAKRMASNSLSMDDVKKKRKMDGDKYMVVNDALDDPTITDATRLVPLSNRKMWKIRHKKSLVKKNKRLEKKGIYQS